MSSFQVLAWGLMPPFSCWTFSLISHCLWSSLRLMDGEEAMPFPHWRLLLMCVSSLLSLCLVPVCVLVKHISCSAYSLICSFSSLWHLLKPENEGVMLPLSCLTFPPMCPFSSPRRWLMHLSSLPAQRVSFLFYLQCLYLMLHSLSHVVQICHIRESVLGMLHLFSWNTV